MATSASALTLCPEGFRGILRGLQCPLSLRQERLLELKFFVHVTLGLRHGHGSFLLPPLGLLRLFPQREELVAQASLHLCFLLLGDHRGFKENKKDQTYFGRVQYSVSFSRVQ